jgi:hypothetical protein
MKKGLLAFGVLFPALLLAACTPTAEPSPTPGAKSLPPASTTAAPETSSGPNVATDWSRLTPYEPEEPLYTRRYAEYTDTLVPANNYGPLIPYLGEDRGDIGRLYGLVTLAGELVTDPVFTRVWRGGTSGGYHDNPPLPYLMLTKGVSSSSPDEWPGPSLWAMAAPDGSWCTEFKYVMEEELVIWGRDQYSSCSEDGLFVLDGDALVYLDGATGGERIRVALEGDEQAYSALASARWADSEVLYSLGTHAPPSDHPPEMADGHELHGFLAGGEGWRWYRDGTELVFLREGEKRRLKTDVDPAEVMWGQILFLDRGDGGIIYMTMDGKVLADYPMMRMAYDVKGYDQVTGEKFVYLPTDQGYDFYDGMGEKLLSVTAPARSDNVLLAGGLVQVNTSTASTLYNRLGEVVFRYPLAPGEQD